MSNSGERNFESLTPFKIKYLQGEVKEESSSVNNGLETNSNLSGGFHTKTNEYDIVSSAYLAGNTDENSLTNVVFFLRHPERKNHPIEKHEQELVEEWLYIRNNIVRPAIADLKSKKKGSPTENVEQIDKLLNFAPQPIALPEDNPVEFAPEPTGSAHWPLISKDKDWHVVSYKFGPGKNDFVRGRNTSREFYARRGSDRFHYAIDLYGRAGEYVVAIQDGIFLYAIENFLGNTSAIYIQHTIENPYLIAVYGEVKKKSWENFGLKIGATVKAGQVIAELGITPGGSSMLHFETFGLGIKEIKNRLHTSYRSWKIGGEPPKYMLNPTKFLLAVRKQELERRQQMNSLNTQMSMESSDLQQSESFFGSIISDVRGRFMQGKEFAKVFSAYNAGNTDENSLTNILFFARHPERKNQPIKKSEKKEADEWIDIRNKIVRPAIAELKKHPPGTTTTGSQEGKPVELPFVLAGPIVRRATRDSIWFWIALSEKITDISASLVRYDTQGQVLNEISVDSPAVKIIQAGKNLWIALSKVVPTFGTSFPTDTIIGYDLNLVTEGVNMSKTQKLSELQIAGSLNYPPFHLPTLLIGEKNTQIAHGSCRRPGSGYTEYPDTLKDAFEVFDEWMSQKAASRHERPNSIIFTGDQIYADDLELPMFDAIQNISNEVFAYSESINLGFFANLTLFNQPAIERFVPSKDILARPVNNEKSSMRRKLTHYSTSPIGFTTSDGGRHLLSFPEFASMYLLIWCPELWQKYCVEDYQIQKDISEKYPTLVQYGKSVKACRRVMANCATYNMMDDHDSTDDTNLDREWEEQTQKVQTAQQVLSNAFMTYFLFQAWGNDPDIFEDYFVNRISSHLSYLQSNNGVPEKNVKDLYSIMLDRRWSFVAASNPKALCVDIRTGRDYPATNLPLPDRTDTDYEDKKIKIGTDLLWSLIKGVVTSGLDRPAEKKGQESAILVGKRTREHIERHFKDKFAENAVMLIVLPTPLIGHPFHIAAQEATYPYPAARYPGDWELFDDNSSQRPSLIYWLKNIFNPSALVVLSGDVHYGSVIYSGYAFAKTAREAYHDNWSWKLPVIQITSSPIKNGKKILYFVMKGRKLAQRFIPENRARYSSDTEGYFVAAGFRSAELSGDLGLHTVIHQNHLCVVSMPTSQDATVKSVFIGVKNDRLAQTETSVQVDNLDFMKPIVKMLAKRALEIGLGGALWGVK